jgi:hypothetical protein
MAMAPLHSLSKPDQPRSIFAGNDRNQASRRWSYGIRRTKHQPYVLIDENQSD